MSTTIYEEKIMEQVVPATPDNAQPMARHEQVHVIRDAAGEYREEIVENVGLEQRIRLAKLTRLIWLGAGLVEFMIGLRIVLKLIAANPNTPFAQLTYSFTDLFLWPFVGLTITPTTGTGIVLELSSFIALVVYAIGTWGLIQLLYLVFTPSTSRTVSVYDQYRS